MVLWGLACYFMFISYVQVILGDNTNCWVDKDECNCAVFLNNLDKKMNLVLKCQSISSTTEILSNSIRNLTVQMSLNLTELHIRNKLIRVVRSFAFVDISFIKLDLSNNQIEEIEANAFIGLSQLESLNLNFNYIKTLHHGSFFGLTSLPGLDLNGQMLGEIVPGVFEGLDTLTRLNMQGNRIHQLEEGSMMGLKAVNDLNIASNNLQVIKSYALNGMTYMKDLNFKEYGIKELEPWAFSGLVNLDSLDLKSNFLAKLVDFTFVGLNKLTYLKLKDNMLETIEHEAFTGLTNLTELDLSKNELVQLANNTFNHLPRLEILNFSRNKLKQIAENAFGKYLKVLDLSSNRLDKISNYYFTNLSQLVTLDLSSNVISNIEVKAFYDLLSLEYLYLNDNCLYKLSETIFASTFMIKLLDLNDNTLIKFSVESFKELWLVEEIRLSPNYVPNFSIQDKNNLALSNMKTLDIRSSYFLERFCPDKYLVSLRLDNSLDTELVVESSDNSSLTQLSYLYLRNFGKVNQVNFRLLSNLIELDLSLNQISDLSYFFENKKYTSLKSLFLRGSRFNFSLGLFTNFPSLTKLDIGSARFNLNQTLSGKLKSLDTLYLDNLGIESDFVKKYFNFFNMNKLVYLDISNNRLEYFPSAKYSSNLVLGRIKWLNLRNNRLKEFSFDFLITDSTFYIETLDLGNNMLENMSLIERTGAVLGLKPTSIYLDNNGFDFNNIFPLFFVSIFSVTDRLDLSYNKLRSEKIDQVTNLIRDTKITYLNLSNNDLVYFSPIIYKLTNEVYDTVKVKYIDLSHNKIEILTTDSFENCFLLSSLNLSYNQLVDLPEGIFDNQRSLKRLDLSVNKLDCLDYTVFSSNFFLELLNLSSNFLHSSCLIPRLFIHQTNLLNLDLSNNSIDHLNPYLFQNMARLKMLSIHLNPIKILEPLVGLHSIENMVLSSFLLDPDQNTINLNISITPNMVKNGALSSYYKAVFVNYGLDIVLAYDDNDCDHILFLARNLILLNLKDEFALDKFLTECASFSENLFKPSNKLKNRGLVFQL